MKHSGKTSKKIILDKWLHYILLTLLPIYSQWLLIMCWPKTSRWPHISPNKMGLFWMSRELQFGICNHGDPCESLRVPTLGLPTLFNWDFCLLFLYIFPFWPRFFSESIANQESSCIVSFFFLFLILSQCQKWSFMWVMFHFGGKVCRLEIYQRCIQVKEE